MEATIIKNILITTLSLLLAFTCFLLYLPHVTPAQYNAGELYKMAERGKLISGLSWKDLPLVKPKKFYTLPKNNALSVFEYRDVEIGIYDKLDDRHSINVIHSAYINQNHKQIWLFLDKEQLAKYVEEK